MNILRNQKYIIGLASYSGHGFNYFDPILIAHRPGDELKVMVENDLRK